MIRTLAAAILACALAFLFTSQGQSNEKPVEAPSAPPGLVANGTQPKGGLSGKIIYTHGGHGYTADNKGDGHWSWQRGPGHQMIEDLGNYDQMAFLVDYLFRAGATVVPQRPVGHQTNEVVLDNTDDNVKFVGDWEDGTGAIYFGKAGAVPYRVAHTSKEETAYARYTPKIPEAGFYPVYAWTSSGGDRATDQLYRVRHPGGDTEVIVNHRRVGNGPVYLGTYYFDEGREGWVDISNRSNSADSVVVADMIRFGNGMGDIDRGGGVSGFSREEEAGLYWVMWHVNHAQGIAESDYRVTDIDRQATISLSPIYAAFMYRAADGRLKDRVFVSFHSNAGGGKSRGVLGLLNGNNDPMTATPNQLLLAKSLAQKVNDDMVSQAGKFEHDWHDRGDKTTLDRDDIEFGEINNKYIDNEFDATIVEVAFHDNAEDAQLLRDPKVRDAVARATYQGLLNYFRKVDNNETSAVRLPAAVAGLHVETSEAGSATLAWVPPATNSYLGDAAAGYRIYASTNGYGFDGGTVVSGEKSNSSTLKNLDPKQVYYFKVLATNEGGESPPSEVVAVLPSGGPKRVLVVNGFDWLDRTMDPKQTVDKKGDTVDRVRPRQSNSRDYVIQVATAVEAAAPDTHLESASNEAVISGAIDLTKYPSVIWILGQESSKNRTFDEVEQKKVETFIAAGGNLLVSGTEIGWELDHEDHGREFYQKTLKASFAADDAGTHEVNGAPESIFADLPKLKFDDGTQFYDASYPDVMKPAEGAKVAFTYGNDAGGAGIQAAGAGGRGSVVLLGFPFETITPAADRAAVMKRVLDYFNAKK